MAGLSTKLLSHGQLLAWRGRQREAGLRVVHCHGCFDIVHPGHIAHLQEARSLGDVLMVSVSSDANVSKGPARPLIPDDLRAASLAALECVDAVYVNPHATAVELLGEVRPDVFVKGKEYESSVDPRFLLERDTVTAAGGRVVFTSGEIVYSSTALISTLERTDPFEAEKLGRLRERYGLTSAALAGTVRGFEGKRVVVIGDYIRDRYHFCDATAIASEGPMMTLRLLAQKDYDGGAAVIARHAAAMGAEVSLVTSLPGDGCADSAGVRERLEGAGICVRGLANRRDLVTKHRYLCETTKVLKVDEGSVSVTDSTSGEALAREVAGVLEGADAVILADFGFGLLTPTLVDRLLPMIRERSRVVSADVSGRRGSLLRFQGVDLLTPTERELRETVGDFASGLSTVAWQLMHETKARNLLITLGRQGAIAFDHPPAAAADSRLRSEHVPALTRQALDPLGCGDALLTAATLTLATGASLQAATLIGSAAAATQAMRLGNDTVTSDDLLDRLLALGDLERGPVRLAS